MFFTGSINSLELQYQILKINHVLVRVFSNSEFQQLSETRMVTILFLKDGEFILFSKATVLTTLKLINCYHFFIKQH